jgi:CRISPR/Cas system-associated protein Csm6
MNKIDTQFTDALLEIDKRIAQDDLKKDEEAVKKLNATIKLKRQILIDKGYAKIVEKEQTRLVPIAQARLLSKYIQKLIFRTIKVKTFTLT